MQNSYVEMGAYEIGVLRQSPEISVIAKNGAELRDGGSISFGSVAEFSSNSKTYIIKNVGTTALTGISFNLKGSTRIKLRKPSENTLGAGATMEFTVSFLPNKKGTETAKLTIRSNDEDENPFDITLRGKSGSGRKSSKSSPLFSAASPYSSFSLSTGDYENNAITTMISENGSKYLVLTVDKTTNLIQQNTSVEVSSNLTDWYSGDKHTTTLVDSATVLRVRDNIPLTQDRKRYIRLR